MANKTGLTRTDDTLELFYQYSLNGLQEPVATDEELKAKMRGDLRESISAGVSTQTGLYLLECFGSAGYALSYIRSGQDRGDFSILRAWIPTIFQYDAKNLVSFLKETLDTLDRLAYEPTAELQKAMDECANKFQYKSDKTTRKLFSQIETEPRGSNAPYAWCWLKEKSIEKVISDYIPQSNFGQYRGVFFVDTQSAPQELSPDLVVIKEDDLKPVITIPTLSPRLTPEIAQYGIKPEDFNLSRLIIDSTTINLSDKGAEQFECWEGAEVEASWQFKSEAFAPIVKRAKIQSEQDIEKLILIQARDVRRRFSREEFRIDNASSSDFTTYYQPVVNKFFNQEYSLVDFKDGPLSISFKTYLTKRFKPDSIVLEINIDHFLNPSSITAPVVEMRLSKILLEVDVHTPIKKYPLDAQVRDKLTKQLEGLRTDSFEIKVTSSIYPTSNTARVTSSTPQGPQTSGKWPDDFPTSKDPKATPNDPLKPQVSDIDPSSVDNLEERSKEKKRGVMKWVNMKWVNLVSYIGAVLFFIGLVLVLIGVITLQWRPKSNADKEEQATQIDSIITTVDSLQNDLQSFTTELLKADSLVKASLDSIQQAKWQDKISSSQDLFSGLDRQLSNLNGRLDDIKTGTKAPSTLQFYSDSLSKYQESLRKLLNDLIGIQSSVNRKDSSRLTDDLQKILDSLSSLQEDLDQLSTKPSVTPALKQSDREEAGKKIPDWMKWGGMALLVLLVIIFAVFMSLRKKDKKTDSVDTPSSDKDSGKRSDKDAGKRSDKDASKRSNKDADKRSDKASNGNNTKQRKSISQSKQDRR